MCYMNLASTQEGDPESARFHYEQALDLWNDLRDENPAESTYYDESAADCHRQIGVIQQRVYHDLDAALDSYQKAFEIRTELTDQNPSIINMVRSDLIACHMQIAASERKRGDFPSARDSYKTAIEIAEDESAQQLRHRFLALRCYRRLASLEPEVAENEIIFREKLSEFEKYVDKADLAVADWGYLGQLYYSMKNWDDARNAFENGISLRQEKSPTSANGPRWWKLTICLAHLDENEQAQSYYQQLVEKLDQETPNYDVEPLRAEAARLLGLTTEHAKSD